MNSFIHAIGLTKEVVSKYVIKMERRPSVRAEKDSLLKKMANPAKLCTHVKDTIRQDANRYVYEKEKMLCANAKKDLYLARITRHASQFIHATRRTRNHVLKSASKKGMTTNALVRMALNWKRMERHARKSILVIKKTSLDANINVIKMVLDSLVLATKVSLSEKTVKLVIRFILVTKRAKVVVPKNVS